jgi:hypothetical protein
MTNSYEQIAQQIGKLVDQKNAAYGSSFAESHKILSVLYPNGIKPEQYTDALAIIRVIDKLFRIATSKDAFGESPWRDIAGYALLGLDNHERARTADTTSPAAETKDKVQSNRSKVSTTVSKK